MFGLYWEFLVRPSPTMGLAKTISALLFPLGPFRFAPPIYFFFPTLIYFLFPTACIQTKREKEKKEKKKSRRKRAKGKRFCYGLLGEKKMENLGQARISVIDGSKVELGDLENNFMEKSMVPEPLL